MNNVQNGEVVGHSGMFAFNHVTRGGAEVFVNQQLRLQAMEPTPGSCVLIDEYELQNYINYENSLLMAKLL